LKVSTVLMSGLGAPFRTATPAPEFASTTRDAGASLPLPDQVIDAGDCQDRDIEHGPLLNFRLQWRCGTPFHDDFMTTGFFRRPE